MGEGATKKLAVQVIRTLRSAGHEALLAGGCVRDMLLGHRPIDYDVATSATPAQVKALFRRVLMVGAKFGVAMVIQQGRRIEVATFRSDLSYSDGRRPDAVKFVSARQDALRRDFTINGMFYDPLEKKVVDYVGGQQDLAAGVIRAIGQPDRRFSEDYLRMLRAVRFAARLGFRIDPATADAIARHAASIAEISGERIRDELEKILANGSAGWAVDELHRLGLLKAILPELYAKDEILPAARLRLQAVGRRGDVLLALGALLGGLEQADLAAITRRWGASNRIRESLVWISRHLNDWPAMSEISLAGLKRMLVHPAWPALRTLWRVSELAATGRRKCSDRLRLRVGRIDRARIMPPPFVKGADLKKMGIKEGPLMGEILSAVYEEQLNERFTRRHEALARARQLVEKSKAGKES